MGIRCFQVDAFTTQPFAGNPAAVCLLEDERDAAWMQRIANEMNLSETAFVRPQLEGFDLRWFTPETEVELCGHATLAAAHVLWSEGLVAPTEPISFATQSGELRCAFNGTLIELDFPATPVTPAAPPPGLLEALDVSAEYVGKSKFDKFVLIESESKLRALKPDFRRLREIAMRGVIVTSLSTDASFDFVSRYFAPGVGIDEDPVTGSAHCCLAPLWGDRLGKREMVGYQASRRGGVVRVRLAGNRVVLGGGAVTMFRGNLSDPAIRGLVAL